MLQFYGNVIESPFKNCFCEEKKKKKKRQGKGEQQQNKQSKTPEAFLFAKQCAHVHTQKQLI